MLFSVCIECEKKATFLIERYEREKSRDFPNFLLYESHGWTKLSRFFALNAIVANVVICFKDERNRIKMV